MKEIYVAAGILERDGKILCARRGWENKAWMSFRYEFPGGKIEAGETPEAALVREIREELNLGVSVGPLFVTISHQYPDFLLHMKTYRCTCEDYGPLKLTVHKDCAWVEPEGLDKLDWVPADGPVIKKIKKSFLEGTWN
ncbi:MAG: (deoxy)nucleoside triphosphate pyrophosphohydrolase [Fusobacteriaceae bacterium]|nr:(deoxy)nucleoside triphosphate pyrophosphohydrolase [Fusobacteriaceae bacterium]